MDIFGRMKSHVLLLRGVNVGGVKLPMAEFREMLSGLGLEAVATYIQSGNAVFRSDRAVGELEAVIAAGLASRFDLDVALFLWPLGAYEAILDACPYAEEGAAEGKTVHVVFLKPGEIRPGLDAHATAGERFTQTPQALYLHAPAGFGTSELVAKLPKYIKAPQTARNWRSCLAIRDLARGLG